MYSLDTLLTPRIELWQTVPLVLAYLTTFLFAAAYLRWKACQRLNMTTDERSWTFSSRQGSSLLQQLERKFSLKQIRLLDGVPRKGYHFASSLGQIIIGTYLIQDLSLTAQTFLTANLLLFVGAALCLKVDSIRSPAFLFYGGIGRIRDGRLARSNALSARGATLAGILCVSALGTSFVPQVPADQLKFLIPLVYFPIAFGDAMGEIVGAAFGRHQFRVWGIGERNIKSVEGTVAVLLFSIVPLLLVTGFRSDLLLLVMTIGIVSTIVELASPRGTDNFFLPVANCLVLFLHYTG